MEQKPYCIMLTGYILPRASTDISRAFLYTVAPTLARLNVDYDIEVETGDYQIIKRYMTEELRTFSLVEYRLTILVKQQKLEYPKMYTRHLNGKPDLWRTRFESGSFLIRGQLITDIPDDAMVMDLDASEPLEVMEIQEDW